MTLQGLSAKHVADAARAIHAAGQTVTVLDADGPREILARVRMLNAQELANCAELYAIEMRVAAADFPNAPPRKGLLFSINGSRRGVMAVLLEQPSDQRMFWILGVR